MATLTRVQSGESNKDFLFLDGELKNADERININKINIDFPGDDDTEDSSFSLNLGTEQVMRLSFKLYTQTTDRSNGTNATEILTFEEIMPYLKRTIFKKTIGEVLYRLQLTTKFETVDAYFELENFNIKTDNSLYPSGEVSLKFRYYTA